MASDDFPKDVNTFLCGIGHICLQWALIEQGLLAIIAAAENMPLEKIYSRYGTTDMIPRLRLTIRLANENKWPIPLQRRLKAVQAAISRGLNERRNLFVHGAHGPIKENGEVELTMARWPSGKRSQTVTALDAGALVGQLSELAQEVESIFYAYGVGEFGIEDKKDRRQNVAQAKTISRGIRAKNRKRAIKLFWANLKP